MNHMSTDEIERSLSLRGRWARQVRRRVRTYLLRRRRRAVLRRRAKKRRSLWLLLTVLLLLLGAFAWSQSYLVPRSPGRELSLDQLRALIREQRVTHAVFNDEDNRLMGTFSAPPHGHRAKADADKNAKSAGRPGGRNADAPSGAGRFWVSYPKRDPAFPLFQTLTRSGSEVSVDPQSSKAVVRAVSTYLIPLLVLASFFGLMLASRSGSGGIGEVMSFGTLSAKSRKRVPAARVTFADVGGADEAVAELREVVDYLENPERYEEIGAIPPKGVLLFGPPGCGKTLLARAVAGEAGVPFFSVAGAEFVESLVGVGAARVRDLFARVRAVAPAIVFIDELDAAGRRRGAGGSSGGSDEREQTLNQLLVEMDGFEVGAGIVVIGATNRPDILDPALLRPGRFDRHITVDQPDAEGRKTILLLHARGKPMDPAVDFDYLARRAPGFSGADLANVINEAALLSLRQKRPAIEISELQEAIQRVLHGPKRRGRVLSPEERQRAAYHEAGHAVIAACLGEAADVHRVTILLRARGLGSTAIQRDSDALFLTRTELYSKLIKTLGGLAAEELVFGEPSTGAEQDVEQATEIARDIVGRFGMSPVIGRTRLLASDVDAFLGVESGVANVSARTHEEFDHEVKGLLNKADSDARGLLARLRPNLDEIATRLLEEETLEGVALEDLLDRIEANGYSIQDPFRRRRP
jgi:cell division protease FtsH